jgi:hypothetical protein
MKTRKRLGVLGLAALIAVAGGCGDDYGTPSPDGGPADGGKKGLDGGVADGGAAAPDVAEKVDSTLPGVDSAPNPTDANSGEPIVTADAPTDGSSKDVAVGPGLDTSGVDASIDGAPEAGSDAPLNVSDRNTGLDGSIGLDSAPDGADVGEAGGTGVLDAGHGLDAGVDAISS